MNNTAIENKNKELKSRVRDLESWIAVLGITLSKKGGVSDNTINSILIGAEKILETKES